MEFEQTDLFSGADYGMPDEAKERVKKLMAEIAEVYQHAKKTITCKEDAVGFSPELINQRTEAGIAYLLDAGHNVLKAFRVAGSANKCLISPREILKEALMVEAVALILVHNHPGGSLNFSAPDIKLTRYVYRGAEALGIDLLDHIIISHTGSASLRESLTWTEIKQDI